MLEKIFKLRERGTDVKTEILAGVATFLTMAYIIVVNPAILSKTGMPFSGVLFATVLVCAFSSIAMGLYANLPYGVAPGMGINAFFTFTLVLGMGVRWETALGAVFISGIIFIILSWISAVLRKEMIILHRQHHCPWMRKPAFQMQLNTLVMRIATSLLPQAVFMTWRLHTHPILIQTSS